MDAKRNGVFIAIIVYKGFFIQTKFNFFLLFFFSATKASICASIIFILDKKTDLISAPHSLVYLGIVIFFIYFKLSSMLLGIHDPFLPFENLFCALFFAGIWDTLSNFINGNLLEIFCINKLQLYTFFVAKNSGDNGSVKADMSRNGKTEISKKKD